MASRQVRPGFLELKRSLEPYLFFAPAGIILVALVGSTVTTLIWASVHDVGLGKSGNFVGFANYYYLLASPSWRNAFGTTLVWTALVMAVLVPVSLGIALATKETISGGGLLRATVAISWIMPYVAVAIMLKFLMSTSLGYFGYYLAQAGFIPEAGVFSTTPWALVAIVMATVWKVYPFMMIMLLAGLNSIPIILYEAAEVDGASLLTRFRHITLPMLMPLLLVAVLMFLIWQLNSFAFIYLLTGGGPGNYTEVNGIYVYRIGLAQGDFGLAAAASVITLILGVTISLLYSRSYGRAVAGI